VTVTDGPPGDAPGTAGADGTAGSSGAGGASDLSSFADGGATAAGGDDVDADADPTDGPAEGDDVEFTGTVVQTGDPVVLDDGQRTRSVETDADLTLGERVTVRGRLRDDRIDADEVAR
jgi:replication factor A1